MTKLASILRHTRRLLLTLCTLALLGFTVHQASFTDATFTFATVNPGNTVTAGILTFTNDKDAQVIVNATNLRPGGPSQSGTATLAIGGNVPGTYTLSRTSLTDTPSSPALSQWLNLTIVNLTTGTTLYNGTVDAFSSVSLGSLTPGTQQTYQFTLSFLLDASHPANPLLQGATTTIGLRFLGVSS
jgi:hypothetical protein